MHRLITLFVAALCLLPAAGGADGLPSYYDSYLGSKNAEIRSAAEKSLDGFLFWTDSHSSHNAGRTGKVIRRVLEGVSSPKVIFGGDAITNFGDIDSCWKKQQLMEDDVRAVARFYRARGNHDLTGKTFAEKRPYTFSQEVTGRMFRESTTSEGVVRNPADPGACYCYFDEPSARLRYLIFDTTDEVRSEDVFGLKTGIGKKQLAWMAEEAVLGAPEGYSLVAVSHIADLKALGDLLGAVNAHTAYSRWDFSKRPDLRVLFSIGGHSHFDFNRFTGGVPTITCASDAAYKDYAMDPFFEGDIPSRKGSVRECCVSYISIARDLSRVSLIRVGAGVDASFVLKPVTVRPGRKVKLRSSLKDVARWDIYDSKASSFAKYKKLGIPSPNGLKGRMGLVREMAAIDASGRVRGLSEGEAVAVAISSSGEREFFFIRVAE